MRTDDTHEDDIVIKKKPKIAQTPVVTQTLQDKITPVEQRQPTKEKTIGFRVSENDKELLEKFSKMVNNTGAGAFCKKLLYDKYNSSGSTAATILELVDDFDSLSKAEVIELVKAKEKEIMDAEETVRDKSVQRVRRSLRDREDIK